MTDQTERVGTPTLSPLPLKGLAMNLRRNAALAAAILTVSAGGWLGFLSAASSTPMPRTRCIILFGISSVIGMWNF